MGGRGALRRGRSQAFPLVRHHLTSGLTELLDYDVAVSLVHHS
jgi:hypothetical protein